MMLRGKIGGRLFVTLLLFFGAAAGHAQNGRLRPAKKAAAPAPLSVPFQQHEKLSYRVMWGLADAATLELAILGQESLRGAPAWRFQAKASTIKAVRFLYPLDDRFTSFSDVLALASLQFEMLIREPSKKQDRVIRMNRLGEPPPDDGPSVRVPAGTRDPVGLIYSLRVHDWAKAKEAVFPLYDGSKLYEVRAREVISRGALTVPAGRYTASRIELRVFEKQREVTNARFWVWIASDAARTPALIEAEMPFGKLRVELADTGTN